MCYIVMDKGEQKAAFFENATCHISPRYKVCAIYNTIIKVSKGAKIRNRYNQVPHLIQDTNGKVTKLQLDTTNKSQEVSPFPAVDHKSHINGRTQSHSKRKTEKTQKIHKRSTSLERSVKSFTGGLKRFLRRANLTHNSDVDQNT